MWVRRLIPGQPPAPRSSHGRCGDRVANCCKQYHSVRRARAAAEKDRAGSFRIGLRQPWRSQDWGSDRVGRFGGKSRGRIWSNPGRFERDCIACTQIRRLVALKVRSLAGLLQLLGQSERGGQQAALSAIRGVERLLEPATIAGVVIPPSSLKPQVSSLLVVLADEFDRLVDELVYIVH